MNNSSPSFFAKLCHVFVLLKPYVVRALKQPAWGLRAIKKAVLVFQAEGLQSLKKMLLVKRIPAPEVDDMSYQGWIRRFDTLSESDRRLMKARIAGWGEVPLISVLMPVYNPPPHFLDLAIQSVRQQIYPHWTLCIADDASTDPAVREILERHQREDKRIHVVFRPQNGHISHASNSALDLVEGDFTALLDHDDLLAEQALYWVAEALQRTPDAGLVYSDEDKIDEQGIRYHPYFKSEFNYELLLAQNMVCHLGVYRTALLKELGGFRPGFEGAQDYDLVLRVIERLSPHEIVHIPRVLYHWRAITGSTALDEGEKDYASEASRKAVQAHLDRTGRPGRVVPAPEIVTLNRVIFTCPEPQPLVSILIPTRDRADLLQMCIDSIIQRSTYTNYEIVIVDNGSQEAETFALFKRLPADRVRVVRDESPFNFSSLNNLAAREAKGTLLCMMNNDIEILTPGWLEEMVSFACQPEIGCVGARLWYPDGRLQHGGVIVGLGGVAGHSHKYLPRTHPGYFHRAVLHQSLSAVTAACLLIRRSVFEEVSGLEEALAVAFNDVDFCLRVREAGYRNVWTPYAEMNHHESASRGYEDNPVKQARFARECLFVQERWGDTLMHDPAYSPNLTLSAEDFSMAWPPRVGPI